MSKKEKKKLNDDEEFSLLDDDAAEEEAIQAQLPILTEVDGVELPSAWGQTSTNIDEVRKHRQSFNLKHGMFANVPMICKGSGCPLSEICTIPLSKRPVLKRCPIEIAGILDRYDKFCEELNIGPEDYFNQSQVKDIVDIEIKLMRAQGQLAISGDFIQQVVAGVDDRGNEYYKPELHKATEYEEQLHNRKRKIMADLMATRKSKGENEALNDPSSFAADLMQRAMKAKAAMSNNIIDADVIADNTTNEEE